MWLIAVSTNEYHFRNHNCSVFIPHPFNHTQEGSCIVSGISYDGVDGEGRVHWSALTNIKLIKFETGITLQVTCSDPVCWVTMLAVVCVYIHVLI